MEVLDSNYYHGNRKYDLNQNYFKHWSSNMAYILGFIASDGNISSSYERLRYILSISLQESDIDVLEKIKKELNFNGFIRSRSMKYKNKEYNIVELYIYSKIMVLDLINLGITPVKSFTLKFPDMENKFLIDFIRGYFDGDGCVDVTYTKIKGKKYEIPQIRVRINSGSKELLEIMQEQLQKFGLKKKKVNKFSKKEIYEICYSTKESLMLYDLFYSNESCLKSDRKFNKFKKITELRRKIIKESGRIMKLK